MIYTVGNVPQGTKAFLNGNEIQDVIEVDPDNGVIKHFKRDESGNFILEDGGDDLIRETLLGQVRIEFPEGWVA